MRHQEKTKSPLSLSIDNSPNMEEMPSQEAPPFQLHASDAVPPAQPPTEKPNNTGLPDDLKAGIESLSGLAMDDVRVHYNSDKPAQLQAHAYAQGTDIHIGPGQEKHLPHEAWHVVQQKQGRVRPTVQMQGGAQVNDDAGLEKEADVMGAKAIQFAKNSISPTSQIFDSEINDPSRNGKNLKEPFIQMKPFESSGGSNPHPNPIQALFRRAMRAPTTRTAVSAPTYMTTQQWDSLSPDEQSKFDGLDTPQKVKGCHKDIEKKINPEKNLCAANVNPDDVANELNSGNKLQIRGLGLATEQSIYSGSTPHSVMAVGMKEDQKTVLIHDPDHTQDAETVREVEAQGKKPEESKVDPRFLAREMPLEKLRSIERQESMRGMDGSARYFDPITKRVEKPKSNGSCVIS